MKILLVQPFADGIGHFGPYAFRLSQELSKAGHEVVLCTNVFNPQEYSTEAPLFRIEQLGHRAAIRGWEELKLGAKLKWLYGRVRVNTAVLAHAKRLVAAETYDVVHLLSYELVSTAVSLSLSPFPRRTPGVIEISAPNFDSSKHQGSFGERAWRRLHKVALTHLLKRAIAAVTVYSDTHAHQIRTQLGLAESFPFVVAADSRKAPPLQISKSAAREAIQFSSDGWLFLYFGTLRSDKGIKTLLAAAEQIRGGDTRVLIVGKPIDIALPENLPAGVKTRLGFVKESEIPAYFFAADALLLPYAGHYSGSSGPLFDAAAYGLPVICTDVSEMGRLVRERGLGIVVQPDNPIAFADAMKTLMGAHDEELRRYAENGRKMIDEVSAESVADRLIRAYRLAVESGGSG